MRDASGHNYWNSSFIIDVAMGQIPRSTERISCITHTAHVLTDLHIYNLDAVPPIHVVSNYVDTDKLTTANGGTFTSSSASRIANHVKARI